MNRDELYNNAIKKLLDKADIVFEKSYNATELSLLRVYKKVLADIRVKLESLYAEYGLPTMTELRKFNRLTNLEKQLAEIIGLMQRTVINTTALAIKKQFKESYGSTTDAIGSTLEINFTMLPQKSVEYVMRDNLWLDSMKNWNAKLLTDTKRELESALRTNAREEVASGLIEGKPYLTVAKAIKERFDITATRAKTIAFTEMHKSHSMGRLTGIDRANEAAKRLGIDTEKIWKHNHVGIPRPKHLAMDGKAADENGLFHVDGESMQAPGLGEKPENNINCHCSAQFRVKGL